MKETAPAIFTDSRCEAVSPRYVPFHTGDFMEKLIDQGWQPQRCGQVKSRDKLFSRHMLVFSRSDLNFGDEQVEIVLFNSHDGQRALHFELGIYRFVCANGLIDASTRLGAVNLRHLKSEEEMQVACQSVIAEAPQVVSQIQAWKNKKLNPNEQVNFAQWALRQRWPQDPPLSWPDILQERRDEDRLGTLWSVFNTIQENLMKGEQSYRNDANRWRTTRPIHSINSWLNLNKCLWAGAQALADGLALPA
jgi:hypothetical protein